MSLFGVITEFLTRNNSYKQNSNQILRSLINKDLETFNKNLKSLYSSIPYNLFTKNNMYKYEGYHISVFYSYLKALGLDIIAEDVTNKGRIDLTIILPDTIYIIEFKVDDGKDALKQIKEKKYYQKYIHSSRGSQVVGQESNSQLSNVNSKLIYLVGIEFDINEKNISNFEYIEKTK